MATVSTAKPTFAEYPSWLTVTTDIDAIKFENHYKAVTAQICTEILHSAGWRALLDELPEANDAYKIAHKSQLLTSLAPTLFVKPYASLLNKSYRKNVKNNKNWPDPPDGGWILAPTWLGAFKDVFRTTITVSYLDGVQFLYEKLKNATANAGADCEFDLNSTPEGYYAGHFILKGVTTVPDLQFGSYEQSYSVEIQMTTHVKEAVKSILHPIYEKARMENKADHNWQWDFSCDEFIANNLGHIIHYVEGMIVKVRKDHEGAAS
ncbi:MAG: hypothetical protein U1D69_12240 [Polynucleobacter sp.]|nr:hypothetical protein [Polynucleobacter sp.]